MATNEGKNLSFYHSTSPPLTNKNLNEQQQQQEGEKKNDEIDGNNIPRSSSPSNSIVSSSESSSFLFLEENTTNVTKQDEQVEKHGKKKALFGICYFISSLIITVLFIASSSTMQNHKMKPLVDLATKLSPIPKRWCFSLAESLILVNMFVLCWLLISHKHRCVIIRRFCFVTGTLYYLRCLTMFVTVLPIANDMEKCVRGESTFFENLRVAMSSGAGSLMILASNGEELHLCSDYIFSGHTTVIMSSCLFICHYTRMKGSWISALTRNLYWSFCSIVVFIIPFSHEHYSVDILLAYLLASMFFTLYHHSAQYLSIDYHKVNNNSYRVFYRSRSHMETLFGGKIWLNLMVLLEDQNLGACPTFKLSLPFGKFSQNAFHFRQLKKMGQKAFFNVRRGSCKRENDSASKKHPLLPLDQFHS